MRIEIAGVPVEVVCKHPRAEAFFRGYETDRPPLFRIEPTEADLEQAQAGFDAAAKAEGRQSFQHPPYSLEVHAIHTRLAERLVFRNVLLMHGSALCIDGQAIIFTAPSGTGKSTHARMWRDAFGDRVWMINDDKPMLRIEPGQVTACGTPWNGKHKLGCNGSAPLKAIVSLNRGEENRIVPMGKAEAFPVLRRQTFGSKDPAIAARILSLQAELLNAVDFYRLWCDQTPEAARVAYKGVMSETVQR